MQERQSRAINLKKKLNVLKKNIKKRTLRYRIMNVLCAPIITVYSFIKDQISNVYSKLFKANSKTTSTIYQSCSYQRSKSEAANDAVMLNLTISSTLEANQQKDSDVDDDMLQLLNDSNEDEFQFTRCTLKLKE